MLSRDRLERIAETLSAGNVGHAEKLYLQDIVLSTVSRTTATDLVFKGETALMKLYQLDRFSEDLDFTARSALDFDDIVASAVRDLEHYGAAVPEQTHDETEARYHVRLGIQGPLYTGDRRSLSFLRLEVNKRSSVSTVQTHRYTPAFPDIRTFELTVLDEPEILAEKVRALCTREQPRDLYDIYHLLCKSVRWETPLIREKLEYYDLEYEPAVVLDRARRLESNWSTLEPLIYSRLPPFETVYDQLKRVVNDDDGSR